MEYTDFFKLIAANEKNHVRGAYILHGTEEYIKDAAVSAAAALIDPAARAMNMTVMDDCDAQSVIAACETLPFFSDFRLVVVHKLPVDTDGKKLCDYAQRMPDTTLLLFVVRGKADMRGSLIKKLGTLDRAVEFRPMTEVAAKRWVMQHAADYDCTITEETARFFVAKVGVEGASMNNELSKAAGYSGYHCEITREHVEKAVSNNIEYEAFSILSLFLSGKAEEGFRAYSGVLADGKERPYDLANIFRYKLRLMIEARAFMDAKKGVTKDAVVKKLGVGPQGNYAYADAVKLTQKQLAAVKRCYSELTDIMYLEITGRARSEFTTVRALARLCCK